LIAAVFSALALIPAIPGSAVAATGGMQKIGILPITPDQRILPDAPTRRLLAIGGGFDRGTVDDVIAPDYLSISAFDGDTLKRIRSVMFTTLVPQAGRGGKPLLTSLDEHARRLYVIAYQSHEQVEYAVDPHLVAIDIDDFTIKANTSLLSVFPPGMRLLGMTRQKNGLLLVVAQFAPRVHAAFIPSASARAAGIVVAEIDPSGAKTWGPEVVRGCQSAINYFNQSEALSIGGAIFVGCGTPQIEVAALPGVQAVAAVNRSDTADQQLFLLPGAYARGDVYADVDAGRLLLIGSDPSSPAQAVWVFDAHHKVFVGQVASGELNVLGAGLNPRNGRLYVDIDGALLVTNGRGFEIPQAATFPLNTNTGAVATIPFNSSFIIPTRGPSSEWIFVVFRDTLPENAFSLAKPPDVAPLDKFTTETPEYSGDGQAFGLRIHRIGGVNAAVQNVFSFPSGDFWSPVGDNTRLKDGDRDVHFARIARLHLSQDEASAEAISADRDANTVSDYETLSKQAPLGDWPYDAAQCGDFGAGAAPSNVDDARASCSLAKETTSASAVFNRAAFGVESTDGDLWVSVGSSASGATLTRNARKKMTTTAWAEARNVVISDAIHIGLIRSEATAEAVGLRGGAHAVYTRTFEGVRIGDSFRCGEATHGVPSATDVCDPYQVARQISLTLGSQVHVEIPEADVQWTPGGVHGHAARDPWQHQQDVVINNEEQTEKQVPALRLTVINDRALASRLIFEFAATKADATSIRVVPVTPDGSIDIPPVQPPRVLPRTIARPSVMPPLPPHEKVVTRIVRTLGHGWRVMIAGRAGMVARSAVLWGLFASPVFFAARRRALRRTTAAPP
jgi:hypothetical protein